MVAQCARGADSDTVDDSSLVAPRPVNNPRAGGDLGQTAAFGHFVLVLAGLVVVLGGLHLAASLVSPICLALVLALIFWPLYAWLGARPLPA